MLLFGILASALLFCSVVGQDCSTSLIKVGVSDVNYLLQKLQKDPPFRCSCSANVTSCLCLPIPSDNCTTPCFQEGLSQIGNATQKIPFELFFNRTKRNVAALKERKCPFFSCAQPCNQTTTGNMVTFLKSLLETFQKAKMKGMKNLI